MKGNPPVSLPASLSKKKRSHPSLSAQSPGVVSYCNKKRGRAETEKWTLGEASLELLFFKKNCGKYSHVELFNPENAGKVSMIFLSWC